MGMVFLRVLATRRRNVPLLHVVVQTDCVATRLRNAAKGIVLQSAHPRLNVASMEWPESRTAL
jgi:hypothetical protein